MTVAAAIRQAGVVLSHPERSTTESSGRSATSTFHSSNDSNQRNVPVAKNAAACQYVCCMAASISDVSTTCPSPLPVASRQ